jgi:hypothetical protein
MENKIKLLQAIANFQQEVPTIHKGTKGYGYSYADLPSILKIINPLMKKNGLGFTQSIKKDVLQTIIFHSETGQFIESELEIKSDVQLAKMNPFQVLGSQITYLRRYAISSMLGLVTDVDNDAYGEVKKEVKKEEIKLTDKLFDKILSSTDLKKIKDNANYFAKKMTAEQTKQIKNRINELTTK